MSEEMRVQKYLSKAGVCSRRKAEEFMLAGRVKVNNEVCTVLGSKVVPGVDKVEVDGQIIDLPESYIYLLLNKPSGYITSLDDPQERPVVMDLLPESMPRLWPVGRLDWNSEGLLLLTNDGQLTNLMTHPDHEVPKIYAVKVRGVLEPDSPKVAQLREGVEIGPDEVTAPAHVMVKRNTGRNTWLEIALVEGRNRQIRRMCEAINHAVMKLRRVAIGPLTIQGLRSGTYRALDHFEVAALYAELETELPERAQPSRRQLKRERQERRRRGRR